jgi:hypothetical protein
MTARYRVCDRFQCQTGTGLFTAIVAGLIFAIGRLSRTDKPTYRSLVVIIYGIHRLATNIKSGGRTPVAGAT